MPPEAPGPRAGLAEWLAWQEQLHPASIELGLERVRSVAARMGLPARGLRTLTVAGTNGKGSTVAMLTAILGAAGVRVGAYTSPHLLRYNERVSIDGAFASDADLCLAFEEVERCRHGTPLTYFEFGTLAALHLFRAAKVDVQVLEVGLGGRLDAVNIVDADTAVVTQIGIDHTAYLGITLEAIAREKAGILRAGRPAILADASPPANLFDVAREIGADVSAAGREYRYRQHGAGWDFEGAHWAFRSLPVPGLAGSVQFANAAGAIAALEALRGVLPVDETAVRKGLVAVRLPGRFQRIGNAVFDVAHNVEAARVLAANLREAGIARLHAVIGMLDDKPVRDFVRELPSIGKLHAATLPPPRGLSAEQLVSRLPPGIAAVEAHESPAAAWAAARSQAAEDVTILVCGSFLTVAEVLKGLTA